MTNPITTISRERLEEMSQCSDVTTLFAYEMRHMARALLAVMDAKPVSFYAGGAYYNTERAALKDGAEDVTPLYAAPPAPSAPDCEWTFDESQYSWHSACGEDYLFTDGGPVENRVRFCQGCGGTVKVTAAPGGE